MQSGWCSFRWYVGRNVWRVWRCLTAYGRLLVRMGWCRQMSSMSSLLLGVFQPSRRKTIPHLHRRPTVWQTMHADTGTRIVVLMSAWRTCLVMFFVIFQNPQDIIQRAMSILPVIHPHLTWIVDGRLVVEHYSTSWSNTLAWGGNPNFLSSENKKEPIWSWGMV